MKRKRFSHFSYEERILVEAWTKEGKSMRWIAVTLGRSPNTISRELKENKVKGKYISKKAQHKSYWKRYKSKQNCMKVALDENLADFVRKKLKMRWSPERISGYLKNHGKTISGKAIYKYVRSRCLERYLFWKRLRRKRKNTQYINGIKDAREYIEKRPVLEYSGHLEADFIVSSKSNYSLLVIVDRYSRNTWVKRLPNRKHATVVRAFWNIMSDYQVKTITLDNDIAFNCWQKIENTLKCRIYFCHPYHSWEKGLVENTNRWIRTIVPKRKDIREVTEEELNSARYLLNEIPRQCLGYRTAKEVLLNSGVS